MFNTTRAKQIFYFSLAISAIYPLLVYHKLPFRVASHFDINNIADDWMPKQNYFFFHYGVLFLFTLIFGGMAIFIRQLPKSLLNLPNKEYWLTELRREKTFNILQGMLFWIGSFCFLLFLFLFYQIYKANTNRTERIDSYSWMAIIVFLAGSGIILMRHLSHFNRIKSGDEED